MQATSGRTALRLGLFGSGKLGSVIARAAGDRLVWQVTRQAPPPQPVDVAIEASAGAAVGARVDWALATRTPLVIGTTGWQIDDLADRVGDRIGVVVAPNFSLAVLLLQRLTAVLARFCALDPARDPYLIEQHAMTKHDAPSGTALLLARTLLAGCPRKTGWRLGGPLAAHELSLGVLRTGSSYSAHLVGMDAPAETIELRHAARGAMAFADGALAAAEWIRTRKGVHGMDAVAAGVLDPLFAPPAGGAS